MASSVSFSKEKETEDCAALLSLPVVVLLVLLLLPHISCSPHYPHPPSDAQIVVRAMFRALTG